MKDKNRSTIGDFFFDSFIYSLPVFFIFRYRLFSPLSSVSRSTSIIVWWVLAVVLLFLGCLAAKTTRRNTVSIFTNIFLPVEVYFLLVYAEHLSKSYLAAIAASVAVAAAYFALVMLNPKSKKKNANRLPGFTYRKIRFALLGSKTIAVALVFVLLCPLFVKVYFGHGIRSSNADYSVNLSDEELCVANNRDIIAKLDDEVWDTFDLQEKLDILGIIKNIELKHFGIEREIRLETQKMSQFQLGYYSHEDHTVMINIDYLEKELIENVLDSLLHEMRHVYQFRCIELFDSVDEEYKNMLLFTQISIMKNESENYVDGTEADKYAQYYSQEIEIDARCYGSERSKFYFEIVKQEKEGLSKDKTAAT